MTIKELLEKRSKLLAEVEGADEKRFAQIKIEIEKLDYQIAEAKKDEEQRKADEETEKNLRAARPITGTDSNGQNKVVLFDSKKENRNAQQKEEIEARAKALKNGETAKVAIRAAVASSSTALGTATSDSINPAFEQVGTLYNLVNEEHLEGTGAESYKKPFEKSIGVGVITKEGQEPSASAEPSFDYASINKVKIVAYVEVNEEVEKLPSARYLEAIEKAALGAWHRKLNKQIMNGSGDDELVGITKAPEKIISSKAKKNISTINENTLDDIIFDYGGDEEVEGEATLMLNKLTLKEFAKVKGADKRRAYDIVVRGNSGTINGTPFLCTSTLPAIQVANNTIPYMVYGKLKGYELAYFADLEVAKSKDYKFKDGTICIKVSGIVGGSPASYNGFMSVFKESSTQSTQDSGKSE